MEAALVGTVLWGYCGGAFGRDSYEPKRIEAAGADWIVARELDVEAGPLLATFRTTKELLAFVAEYSSEQERERWNNR